MMDCDVEIGRRISSDGRTGTVLYVGAVTDTQGIWLGVDWDDPTCGKHDGSHNNQRYFRASSPTSGSFIRPKKADFGISFSEAVNLRYCDETTGLENLIRDDEIGGKTIEKVGFQKIKSKQNPALLRVVAVPRCRVSSAGPHQTIRSQLPTVQELDLSENLLSSWVDVAAICVQLPKLHSLSISHNRLSLPEDDERTCTLSFPNVQSLVAASMGYDWSQFASCSRYFVSLSALVVAYNRISRIDSLTRDSSFRTLVNLDLEGNPLGSDGWNSVLKLGCLKSLQELNLNSTGIEWISYPDPEKTSLFPALSVLYLSDNQLSKWRDINELNKLNSLECLNIIRNPICEAHDPPTVQQLFVAAVGSLQRLNRGKILPEERKGAERDYLKRYGEQWLSVDASADSNVRNEFLREHPRFLDLIQRHGAPEAGEMTKVSTLLKTKLINVVISAPELTGAKSVTKKLPTTMSIQKVKGLVCRLLRIPSEGVQLYYTSAAVRR